MDSPIYLASTGLPSLNEQKKRSIGIHWSSLVNDLFYSDSPEPDEATKLRWELGKLMERALFDSLEERFPGEYLRFPELRYDGIYFNIDGYHVPTERVVEAKFTWKSSYNHSIPLHSKAPKDHDIYGKKYWPNWLQAGGYVIALNGKKIPCKGAYLWLIHPQGDYRKFEPTANQWQRDYTERDLEKIWGIGQEQRKKFCEDCGSKDCEESCKVCKHHSCYCTLKED